jgi:hypothetical protein
MLRRGIDIDPHGEERRVATRLEPRGRGASSIEMHGPASFETRFHSRSKNGVASLAYG